MTSKENIQDLIDKLTAAEISREDIPAMIAALAAIQVSLASRLLEPTRAETQEVKKLFSVPQVALMIGTPKAYIYDLVRKGEIPFVKIGKYIRVKEDDLKIFIEKNYKKTLDKGLYDTYNNILYGRQRA